VEERIFMTNLKGKLPSPKGLIRKIFKNGKVIGLLLAILISIFSVFIIRTCIDIKTENANVVVQAKGISLEKQVLDDHVKTIEAKGYENVTYKLNKIVEIAEKNNVPRRNVNVTSRGNIEDRIKEAIVSRY
jgi:cell division protein FtsL